MHADLVVRKKISQIFKANNHRYRYRMLPLRSKSTQSISSAGQLTCHQSQNPAAICTIKTNQLYTDSAPCATALAVKRELLLAVGGPGTPGGLVGLLAVVTDGSGLPGLVEGLEVEGVEAPVEEGAETVLEEVLGVVKAALGLVVVGTLCEDALVAIQIYRETEVPKLSTYQQ